jgi:succinyl-CoA synthetase beta subunit
MNLLEWQAKGVLAEAGLRVPRGRLARTAEDALVIATEIGGPVMVKAQVPSGGRGRAGGVRKALDPAEAGNAAEARLDHTLLGHRVHSVLVEEALEAEHELYLAVSVDYAAGRPVLLVSRNGGVDVEELAPANLEPVEIDPLLGWRGNSGLALPELGEVARLVYDVFVRVEATLVEVNPLLSMRDGALVAADARVVMDDAALALRPALAALRSERDDALDPAERLKRDHGFDYLELDPDGDIGLIGTGAGGTMLTVDLIARRGGRPIDFVDVRTGMIGRDPTRLIAVLDELAGKPNLRVILVSVFGAITDLAVLAATLLDALRARPPRVPVHARLQGRNQDAARELLTANGIPCHPTLEAAIEAVVGR